MEANSLVIRGGNVVTEDAILPNHDIVVENGTIVRFCTSWATTKDEVDSLIKDIDNL